MLESLKNKRILVVVAHPDDEVIGPGGSINRLIEEFNCKVKCVILGEGITSRDNNRDVKLRKQELEIHNKNILEAKNLIGYHELVSYNYPDNRFDSVDLLDLVKTIEKEKKSFLPEIVFTHHGGDLNIDHQKTFEAVMTACRPLKDEIVQSIITFETYSGTEWQSTLDPRAFKPNLYISIKEENLKKKISAMDCYEYEKREYPHPRSSKSLEIVAQRNGIIIGSKFAEPFCIIRSISK